MLQINTSSHYSDQCTARCVTSHCCITDVSIRAPSRWGGKIFPEEMWVLFLSCNYHSLRNDKPHPLCVCLYPLNIHALFWGAVRSVVASCWYNAGRRRGETQYHCCLDTRQLHPWNLAILHDIRSGSSRSSSGQHSWFFRSVAAIQTRSSRNGIY